MQTKRSGWVTAVAVFHFVIGGLLILGGLGALVSIQALVDFLDMFLLDTSSLRSLGLLVGVVPLLLATLNIVVGVYLLQLVVWAQVASVVMNALGGLGMLALAVLGFTEEIYSFGVLGAFFFILHGVWIYGLLNPQSNVLFDRSGGRRCPNCGRQMEPSWDVCPYCQIAPQAQLIQPQVFAGVPSSPVQREMPGVPTPGAWPEGPATEPAVPMGSPQVDPGYPVAPPMAPQSALSPTAPYLGAISPAGYPHAGGGRGGAHALPLAPTQIVHREPSIIAWFSFDAGARSGQEIRLRGEVISIGRDPGLNDIVLDEPTISAQHAKIRLEEDQFVLYDLASTNGTFVNSTQTQKQVLQDGDRVRFGDLGLTFSMIVPQKTPEEEIAVTPSSGEGDLKPTQVVPVDPEPAAGAQSSEVATPDETAGPLPDQSPVDQTPLDQSPTDEEAGSVEL